MSRGHSQPRQHFGRRVHERCKAKDSIEVIDVDKGEIDVVIIDETETTCQGSTGKASGNNRYPGGVINIDDEEGGSIDAPKNLHDYAKHEVLHSRSSDSSTSEESESDECLISATKFNIPFKMRMHYTTSSSINIFGLGSDSATNTSESDSSEGDSWQSSESDTSDCEIMEDSSGNIREEWERAALRKKMSEKAHFGLEDQTSPSASSGDPGLLSEERPQSKIDVEICSSEDPDESSPIKENNEKETSSDMPVTPEFSNSHLKTRATTSIAEPSSSTNSHDEVAVSENNEHNSGRSTGKYKFTDEFVQNKLAGTVHIEKLLRHPLCPPDVRFKFSFRDDGVFFLDKNMQVPVGVSLGSKGIHVEFYINNGFGEYGGRISGSTKDFTSATAELIDLFSKIETNSSTDADPTTDIRQEESGFGMEKVTVVTYRDKAQSLDDTFSDSKTAGVHHVEELPRHPSCQLKRNCNTNVKDAEASMSTGSHLKSKENTCVAETDTCMSISHVEPAFQTKEHISEACGYKVQSTNKSLQHDKRDGSDVECNIDINDGASFLDKGMRVPGTSLGTDGLHGGSSFQEVAPCCRKTFSCSRQPWEAKEAPDNVGLQEQKKKNLREPLSTTQSHCSFVDSPQIATTQNKEMPVLGETSIYNHDRSEKSELSHGKSSCNSHAGRMLAERSHIPLMHGDLISERERHKESDEYRQADEKEWAARKEQLRIQAEEVQRLKRKRKAESLRLLDMERRQKERVEEIRESEKKGKETENLKERFRVEVTKELFMLEHKFKDMASLLRGLGIPIAGLYPTTHEVNVAYKRALLTFHPDRASKTNIRQQVEAEEKFKLISRLKEKLEF